MMESGGKSILEVSREELYELVWTKPLSRLAAESGFKTSELVRVCERKQVPRPTSGHWVLIRMGRTPERAPLLDFNEQEVIDLPAAKEKRTEAKPTSLADAQHESSPEPFDLSLSRPHPLIKVTRKYLNGLKVPRGEAIPPDLKTCFHLNVTKGTLDRALRIADGILKNWEAVGGTVEIVPSRQKASFETQLKLDGDCAPVVLFELIRRVEIPQRSMDIWSYRQYRYEATGQLVWKVEAFADGLRTKWSDGKVQRLEDVLPSIVSGMKRILATLRQQRIDRECVEKQRAEIRTLRLAKQSRQKELEARKQSLLENVKSFRQAEDIREYVKTLLQKVEKNEMRVRDQAVFEDWIHFAMCFASEIDPLSNGPIYSEGSTQPTNRLIADIDLTLACRTVVDQLSVKDTDELYAVEMDILSSWQGTLARKNFSNNMRSRAIKVLRAALTRAVKLRLIPFNPCVVLTKPKVSPKEVIPLEPEQCRKLITACQKHRLGDMITLAAMTGLRKGELFALNWSAVNLSEGVLVVRRTLQELNGLSLKEPKTKAGKRIVSLGTEALDALKSRLAKALDEGFEPEHVPIVFPNIRGGYMRGSNFDRNVWYPIREAAGIPETFVFHDLRHTQASLMLAAGVDLKVIQKRLGHRDFSTTANTYSHLLQNAENEAVSRVDDLMSKRAPKPAPETGEYSH